MLRRRSPRFRLVAVLACALLAGSVFVGSVAFDDGAAVDVGAADRPTGNITATQLDWNPSSVEASLYPRRVRLTAAANESFHRHDEVAVTAIGPGSDTCTATATVTREGARAVDVTFSACGVPLWDLEGVAVDVSGPGGATALRSDVRKSEGNLASFAGDVVWPGTNMTPSYTTAELSGTDSLATLRLEVRDATVEQLLGNRFMAVLTTDQKQPTSYSRSIGTKTDNQGIWVELDPKDAVPTVVADLSVLAGRAPRVADVAQYQLVVLQPQRLGAEQTKLNEYAIATASGQVEGGGTGADVVSALEPVGMDDRLTFTVVDFEQQNSKLAFCFSFRVTNTSTVPVDWELAFDTTKQPLWGMDPTAGRTVGGVGMKEFWGGRTSLFDSATGLWTIAGQSDNKTIAPSAGGESNHVDVGYCAEPPVPPMNRDAFAAPKISVESGSDKSNVELRIQVSSMSQFLVPWEEEIDLADHVCASTLPDTITAERAILTHIDGTRYLVKGKDADTMFVSSTHSQDFVFAHYNPVGNPFKLGTCP